MVRVALLALLLFPRAAAQSSMLPAQPDWLRIPNATAVYPASFSTAGDTWTLSNGLISRIFTLLPDSGAFGTTEYSVSSDDTSFLRGVGPEARVTVNVSGIVTPVDIGGFLGQIQYLTYYADAVVLQPNPVAFSVVNYSVSPTLTPQYEYQPRWGVRNDSWPPRGVHLAVDFAPPQPGPPGSFMQLNGTGVGCAAPLTCLTGFYACDNTSVPGQCSFPAATATQLCAQWPACVALNCNVGRGDCQARGSLAQVAASPYFHAFVKEGWFPAPDLRVTLHYEMYDGVPLLSKWMTISSVGADVAVTSVVTESLHVPWELRNRMHAEIAYMPTIGERNSMEGAGWDAGDMGFLSFTGLMDDPVNMWVYDANAMGPWGADDAWQYWYDMGLNETMLSVAYPYGPQVVVSNTSTWDTFRVYEVLHDSDTLERQTLSRRKLLRVASPAVTSDLLPAYMVGGDSASIRAGADAAAALGFRALHASVNPFNMSPSYLTQVAADVAYVHAAGLAIGFYVLLQNPPNMSSADEAIDPVTGGGEGVACMATDFHANFRDGIVAFVTATGFDFIDTDGPYEAYPCASTSHSGHAGVLDGQRAQWEANTAWYRSLFTASNPLSLYGSGITITCPDPYELAAGTTAQPVGYTDSWGSIGDSWEWLLMGRVYAFDGTLWKPPTNAIMALDLSRAGGMITPLELQFYDTALAVFIGLAGRYFQSGVLWQNNASLAIATAWMNTMNTHRNVLNGDVIHVRKPTGRSWDAIMHAEPAAAAGEAKCFAIFYNPLTSVAANVSTALNVYYCGFAPMAVVQAVWKDNTTQMLTQDAAFAIPITRSIPALGYDWVALY